MSVPRVAWVTAPSGKLERVLTEGPELDVDLSELTQPAWARTVTTPIDEAALADLLQRSRVA